MGLDLVKTAIAFAAVIALGTGALLMMPAQMGMATDTVLMMVTPSMIAFGLIVLAIGVKHGEYRATH